MKTKKGKKGWMAIKVDLEKAYDRVEWSFLENTLHEIGIPHQMSALIMSCVSNCSMKVLWNGNPSDSFCPTRGIRQGDPLSPYLFVMCIERLSHLINSSVQLGTWKPVRMGRTGPPISHLFFADDLMLFAEAEMDQVHTIRSCLDLFCQLSGQKVSMAKTRVYFSRNVNHRRTKELSTELGFQLTADLGKYLGVPLQHKPVSRSTLSHVVDKVQRKISSWSAKTLSLAGRVTMSKAVLSSIPVYAMQTTMFPKNLCDDLDGIIRKFLWGNTRERKHIPLVAWEQVCASKTVGGLGLRSMHATNEALIMKIGFNLIKERDALWAQVLRQKYGCGSDLVPRMKKTNLASNLWKGIHKIWHRVLEGCQFIQQENREEVLWVHAQDGRFSVKTAYHSIVNPAATNSPGCWRRIWKWNGPERIKTFLWLMAKGRLLTNAARVQRGMTDSSLCTRCGQTEESILHALRDCPLVADVWLRLVRPSYWTAFFQWPLQEWLDCNLSRNFAREGSALWKLQFGVTCWVLWHRRNMAIFQPEEYLGDAVMEVNRRVSEISLSRESLQKAGVLKHTASEDGDCWHAPEVGWCKLNVDGACREGGRETACGGVLRDSLGNWIGGFAFHAGPGSILSAELLAIYLGLQEAKHQRLAKVVVESDSEEALGILQNGCSRQHPLFHLVQQISNLLATSWEIRLRHGRREQNGVADRLASLALRTGVSLRHMNSPPAECMALLHADQARSF